MKIKNNLLSSIIIIALYIPTFAHAGGALYHSGQSLENSARAVGHMSAGALKMVAGIVSVPLVIIGSAGEVSGETGEIFRDFANEPLPIAEDTVSVGPTPAQMFD